MVAVAIELDPLGPLEMDSDGKFSKMFGTTLSSSNSVTMSQSERVMKEIEMYIRYPLLHIDKCSLGW